MFGQRRIESVADVAAAQICCGCGACAYAEPSAVTMVDSLDHGRRPIVREDAGARRALAICPGRELPPFPERSDAELAELRRDWGPVLEVWEGYAGDDELRFEASSGGAASALALHCIQQEGMAGVLHIAARPDQPHLNRTVFSGTRAELLAAAGSRYAPASPCDRLDLLENAGAPGVFIGKPCDVAATARVRAARPALDAKLGLTIAIFCAGTPTTRGTLELLRHLGVQDLSELRALRFRGRGWPGEATAEVRRNGDVDRRSASYEASWGRILQKHRQWRCRVCADHTGIFADVSVGDPWHRPIPPGEPGRSLVLVRTERGRELVRRARAHGALVLEPADASVVARSQPGLAKTTAATWGRLLACRMLGAAAPRYPGFPLREMWRTTLTSAEKLRSLLGTARRVFRKRLRERTEIRPYEPRADDVRTVDLAVDER